MSVGVYVTQFVGIQVAEEELIQTSTETVRVAFRPCCKEATGKFCPDCGTRLEVAKTVETPTPLAEALGVDDLDDHCHLVNDLMLYTTTKRGVHDCESTTDILVVGLPAIGQVDAMRCGGEIATVTESKMRAWALELKTRLPEYAQAWFDVSVVQVFTRVYVSY